jgi:hypothetical protein
MVVTGDGGVLSWSPDWRSWSVSDRSIPDPDQGIVARAPVFLAPKGQAYAVRFGLVTGLEQEMAKPTMQQGPVRPRRGHASQQDGGSRLPAVRPRPKPDRRDLRGRGGASGWWPSGSPWPPDRRLLLYLQPWKSGPVPRRRRDRGTSPRDPGSGGQWQDRRPPFGGCARARGRRVDRCAREGRRHRPDGRRARPARQCSAAGTVAPGARLAGRSPRGPGTGPRCAGPGAGVGRGRLAHGAGGRRPRRADGRTGGRADHGGVRSGAGTA